MANFRYVTLNRLRAEVARHRRHLLLFGLPVTFIAFFMNPVFGILCLGAVLVLWNRGLIRLQGASGEERALGHTAPCPGSLADLPRHFIAFNNIEVPATADSPKREIDLVVLARYGLYVVEVKHVRGEIRGDESDSHWIQAKRSRQDKLYENTLRNPVRQVKGAALALRRYLRTHGIDVWVEGIVVFTHPECTLHNAPCSLPVVRLPDLANTILNRPSGRPLRDFHRIFDAVRALLPGAPEKAAPGLKHVSCFMRDFVTAHDRVHGTMAIDLSKLRGAGQPEPTAPPADQDQLASSVARPLPIVPVTSSRLTKLDQYPAPANDADEVITIGQRWIRIIRRHRTP